MDFEAVTAIVGRKIYRNSRPAGKGLPCLVFSRVSNVSLNESTGPTGTEHARIQVDCYARGDAAAEELAAAVKETLCGWSRDSSPAIGAAQMTTEFDDSEPDEEGGGQLLHVVRQDYSIWYAA